MIFFPPILPWEERLFGNPTVLAGLLELIVFPGCQLPRKRLQDTNKFWHRGFEGTSGRFIVKTTFQHTAGLTVTMHTFSISNFFP